MDVRKDPSYQRFASTPWCAALLSDPALRAMPMLSRNPKASTEDSLFAETLKTPKTITDTLCFYKKPSEMNLQQIDEAFTLYAIGSGMNGMPGGAHGGIVATLLDETLSFLIARNLDLEQAAVRPQVVTAYLNTQYLKTLETPATVLVTVRLTGKEGRKWYLEGSIGNGEGEVFAKAQSLWIELKKRRLKL